MEFRLPELGEGVYEAEVSRWLVAPGARVKPGQGLVEMLTDKARLVGIEVIVVEESYTSKASFLDLDVLPTYDPQQSEKPRFSGKRERRGLYRAANGRRIHADVNASYNILRKAFPDSFGQGIEAVAVRPWRLAV